MRVCIVNIIHRFPDRVVVTTKLAAIEMFTFSSHVTMEPFVVGEIAGSPGPSDTAVCIGQNDAVECLQGASGTAGTHGGIRKVLRKKLFKQGAK